ncbi:MAG TPA: hypothetical protein VFU88_11285 [Ktedonobacterales bacterium]|nr:hypothetical protein [Ktedonobacterales bacterium]
MKTTTRKARSTSIQPAAAEPRVPALSRPRAEYDEQELEEAFEATILRLDGATAEQLFRRAGR